MDQPRPQGNHQSMWGGVGQRAGAIDGGETVGCGSSDGAAAAVIFAAARACAPRLLSCPFFVVFVLLPCFLFSAWTWERRDLGTYRGKRALLANAILATQTESAGAGACDSR